MDSLVNITGITRSENEYLNALDAEKDYKLSSANLFLDELDGLVGLHPALAEIFFNSKNTAERQTGDDLVTRILSRFKPKRETFDGNIGGLKSDRPVKILEAYAGSLVSFSSFIGGNFRVRRITLVLDYSGLVNLKVIRRVPEAGVIEEVTEITGLQAIAGKANPNVLTDPLDLPTEWEGYPVDYYFLYETQGATVQPMNNSTSCGCGRKEQVFGTYANYYGVSGSDLAKVDTFNKWGSANGIVIDGLLTCNLEGLVSSMLTANANYKTVTAYAIRFLAGAMVHEAVIRSNDISFETMVDREILQALRDQYLAEYQTRLTWLAQNTDPSLSDCLECKTSGLTVTGIRA